jgi:myo-inositol-1(or 4)-monophosphatase
VWIVDPLDGTIEFLNGVPEWCVSVALVEDGVPVLGGTCNPVTGQTFLGDVPGGQAFLDGHPMRVSERAGIEGATVLASRSEVRKGRWERFREAPFTYRATGSVAYKLSLVAAGLADATWSEVGKHEWDVAAGVALVRAAGGVAIPLGGQSLVFNQPTPRVPGLLASSATLAPAFLGHLTK